MFFFSIFVSMFSFIPCLFFVTNRAQRCEIHKPAVFGGWEGRGLACESRTYAILAQDDLVRNFEEL